MMCPMTSRAHSKPMLTITIQVAAPSGAAQGVKEHLAMCLERFGDTRVVSIREDEPEQMKIGGCND